MARVYLQIEDITDSEEGGVRWAVDWGLGEGEVLPEKVDDMSDAQYAAWQFISVLRGMGPEGKKPEPGRIIVPGSVVAS